MKDGFRKRLGKTFSLNKKAACLFITSFVINFISPLVIELLYSVDVAGRYRNAVECR